MLIAKGHAQTVYPLYPKHIPNSVFSFDKESSFINEDSVLIVKDVSVPTLTAYLPKNNNKNNAAVIICPGGGYAILASKHEGSDVAEKFNEEGIAAFVLKYRLPNDSLMLVKEIGPLQDAQRAIQMVRMNATKWGIDKNKIGIMGFSAGGHLASTAATQFDKKTIDNKKKISLRPDFCILVYPVISFTDTTIMHRGSAENLLGADATPVKLTEYSSEWQVTPETPPTFLVHAKDDPVKVGNSLVYAEALERNHVPYKMYLYENGGHGFGMNNKTSPVKWMDLVNEWIKNNFN